MHRILLMTVALTVALLSAPPAVAIAPPSIDPDAVPTDVTGPDMPVEQRRACATTTALPDSNFADPPWAIDYLDISEAQKFATYWSIGVAWWRR